MRWDTKLGGALADAVSCNAVVKGFGAEAREDARLGQGRGQMAGPHAPHLGARHPQRHDAGRHAAGAARGGHRLCAVAVVGAGRRAPATSPSCSPPSSCCRAICATSACTSATCSGRSTTWRSWSTSTRSRSASKTGAGCQADPHRQGRHRLRERDLPLRQPSLPLYRDFSVDDPAGRAGRPGRPFGLGQDDLRQADPAALRRERRAAS